MPRPLRIEYPGAIYHVMNRGDRRQDIFRDVHDRQRFLGTLSETCGKTEWQIYAYCLMRNHFHLVIETPQPNLVAGMKWLLLTSVGEGLLGVGSSPVHERKSIFPWFLRNSSCALRLDTVNKISIGSDLPKRWKTCRV